MKEHNYAFQNADTRPRLQRRTQNVYLNFRCSFEENGQNHIHFRLLRIAWHDIFALSHHLLASWNLYIPRVAESKSKCSSSRQV